MTDGATFRVVRPAGEDALGSLPRFDPACAGMPFSRNRALLRADAISRNGGAECRQKNYLCIQGL